MVRGAVVADVGDGPDVAVAYPVPPTGCAESSVVETGDDRVVDSGGGAVAQFDLAAGGEGAVEDQVGPGTGVQGGHVFAGFGDQQRDETLVAVGPPRGVGDVGHGVVVAVGDALVVEVGVDDVGGRGATRGMRSSPMRG